MMRPLRPAPAVPRRPRHGRVRRLPDRPAADAGRAVRIVGAGAGTSALDAVRDGRWFATFTTLPHTEGRLVTHLLVRAFRATGTEPDGVHPVAAPGLPTWWTAATLADHPDFAGEWPGP